MSKSSIPDAKQQLDTTFVVINNDSTPVTPELRNRIISALIGQFDGAQDPAIGTVVIPVPVKDFDGVTVQLWIHDWE